MTYTSPSADHHQPLAKVTNMPTGKTYRINGAIYSMPSARELTSWLDRHDFHTLLPGRRDDLNGLKVHRGRPSFGGERDHVIIQARYETDDEALEMTMRLCNALWKREWDIKLMSQTEVHVYGRPPRGFARGYIQSVTNSTTTNH